MRDGLLGVNAGSIRWLDRLIQIRVRFPDAIRFAPARLANQPISFGPSGGLPLDAVAHLRADEAPTVLLHEGLQPVVIVTADHQGRDLGSVSKNAWGILRRAFWFSQSP